MSVRRESIEARNAALAAGLKQYQGRPCPYGHSGLRWTSGSLCCECSRVCNREANRDKKRQVVCSDCGHTWMMHVSNIRKWKGRCLSCAQKEVSSRPEVKESYRRRKVLRGKEHPNWRGGERHKKNERRIMVQATCIDCGCSWLRRIDNHGIRCRSCAIKEVQTRPEIIAARRETGRKVMAAFGGKIPQPPNKKILRGPDHPFWRGGVTTKNEAARKSRQAERWRVAVFERDDYKCTICGIRGGVLNADHIKPFSLFPELRYSLENGRTLCYSCHKAFGAKVAHGVMVKEAIFPVSNSHAA